MFGSHIPSKTNVRKWQGVMAAFTRGDQTPGTQWKFQFANGYGASVIDDGYGADQGLYELAVLDNAGALTYTTPVTDDVLGGVTKAEVIEALDKIQALPAEVSA